MDIWRLIDSPSMGAPLNMAIDEAIAEALKRGIVFPTLRFYSWMPPAVSIGYFQSIKDIDKERCILKGYDIVRRPTGGRMILHHREFTYSIVVPPDSYLFGKDVLSTYRILHQGVLAGLKKIGLAPEIVSGRDKKAIKSPACFFSPSIYEITIGGRKIMGSAQRRWQKVILEQGSILLDLDINELLSILYLPNGYQRKEAISENASQKITCINKEIGKPAEIGKLKEALIDGFEEALGIRLRQDRLTDYELQRAFSLSLKKYSTPEWNYQR